MLCVVAILAYVFLGMKTAASDRCLRPIHVPDIDNCLLHAILEPGGSALSRRLQQLHSHAISEWERCKQLSMHDGRIESRSFLQVEMTAVGMGLHVVAAATTDSITKHQVRITAVLTWTHVCTPCARST